MIVYVRIEDYNGARVGCRNDDLQQPKWKF
jgi:hypothetical protein